MICPNCGGTITGDGYGTVLHCENVDFEVWREFEPDAEPVYCNDNVLVMLQPATTYASKDQIEKYGTKFMDAINSGNIKVPNE